MHSHAAIATPRARSSETSSVPNHIFTVVVNPWLLLLPVPVHYCAAYALAAAVVEEEVVCMHVGSARPRTCLVPVLCSVHARRACCDDDHYQDGLHCTALRVSPLLSCKVSNRAAQQQQQKIKQVRTAGHYCCY